MALRRAPDRPAPPDVAREIDRGTFEDARRASLRDEPYGSDARVVEALVELDRRTGRAVDVRLFGALVDGEPASYCELRSDGRVAQIEDVGTLARFRNRGLARATVLAAAAAAVEAGHELVFLVADANDWPVGLYRKLGFDELGGFRSFGRSAA